MAEGIEVRHRTSCAGPDGRRCSCTPSYRAQVYSAREGRTLRRTFPTLAAARSWRSEAQTAIRRGALGAGATPTVREAIATLLAGMRDGSIAGRGGGRYKPSTIHGYAQCAELYLLADLGAMRLSAVRPRDVQGLADRLLAQGRDPSTVRNALMPLRVVYRRAMRAGDVLSSPLEHIELPAPAGRRDRTASPAEAVALLGALADGDRALWATALYAGLRRGELQALRVDDLDLEEGVIRVERAWDPRSRELVAPKSKAGRRRVPLVSVLRAHLAEHLLASGRRTGLLFGRDGVRPSDYSSLRVRAAKAWAAAELAPIGLHECRHTFASLMIAAGVNVKALSAYMGHASVTITLDRYGHLMPGNEDQAAGLLEAYLAAAGGGQTEVGTA
jgi:integrase